jgi:hypothetical protein
MALFRDATGLDAGKLRRYESSLLDETWAEGISIEEKIRLAHEEVSLRVEQFLQREDQEDLGRVVATPGLLQAWAYHALALIYRDAYSSHFNQRFERNWRHFTEQAEQTLRTLFHVGVGMVYLPIPRGGVPVVTFSEGPFGGSDYLARLGWVNVARQEGEAGAAVAITVPEGKRMRVTAPAAPKGVAGWNLYLGAVEGDLRRQNAAALELDGEWIQPDAGLSDGPPPSDGQPPDYTVRLRRIWRRG